MANIAADPATDAELRARVYAYLLPYIYPKRKAVEVTSMDGGQFAVDLADAKAAMLRKLGAIQP